MANYLPELRNPIIVDRTDTTDPQKISFKPAEAVVTLKHLLTFTSGLFYPDAATMEGYTSKEMHLSDDPTSEFFRIIIVRLFFYNNF